MLRCGRFFCKLWRNPHQFGSGDFEALFLKSPDNFSQSLLFTVSGLMIINVRSAIRVLKILQ